MTGVEGLEVVLARDGWEDSSRSALLGHCSWEVQMRIFRVRARGRNFLMVRYMV